MSNQISASYTTPELAQQLRRVNCKALFTCVPLLSIALEAAAAAGIPRKHVYLLELPARITKGMEIPADLKTADQLINEGSQIKPLERLVWSKGQGARQTAFLCSSSGTTGLPVGLHVLPFSYLNLWLKYSCLIPSEKRKDIPQKCHLKRNAGCRP